MNHLTSPSAGLRLRSVPGSRSLELEARLDLEPDPDTRGLLGHPGLSPRGQLVLRTEAASSGSEMMRPPRPAEKSMGAW